MTPAERTAEWRLKNPGRNAENARSWRERNPEKAAAQNRAWRAANKDRAREVRRKWLKKSNYSSSPKRIAQSLKDWLKKYGLSPQQYQDILDTQCGKCAICGTTQPQMKNAKRLYVDHCHATKRVRGLLCFRCNTMLGNAADSPERLRKAAMYLERQK